MQTNKLRETLNKVLNGIKHLSRIHNDDLPEDVRATLGRMAFDANEALAEPVRERKPKSARWAGIEYHYAVCSRCGGQVGTGFETTADAVAGWPDLYPFCPYCGTPMQSSEYDGPGARQCRSRKEGGAK